MSEINHEDIQHTYVLSELIKTQAQLRESVDFLNTTLQSLRAGGVRQSLPATLTVAQAAEFCKVKEATIRNWASLKKTPAHRANGSLFFLVDELIEWSSKR